MNASINYYITFHNRCVRCKHTHRVYTSRCPCQLHTGQLLGSRTLRRRVYSLVEILYYCWGCTYPYGMVWVGVMGYLGQRRDSNAHKGTLDTVWSLKKINEQVYNQLALAHSEKLAITANT